MFIVQSPKQDCVIWLGREKGSVYQDPYATTKFYKVEVQWWKPIEKHQRTSKVYMEIIEIKTNNGLSIQKKIFH